MAPLVRHLCQLLNGCRPRWRAGGGMKHPFRRLSLVVCIVTAIGAAVAPAQEFRGTVLGGSSDPSGAPLPGASVTATNEKTNVASATVSQPDGGYTISFLNPGTYRLEVRITGFRAHVQSGITVAVTQSATVNVVLKVGE